MFLCLLLQEDIALTEEARKLVRELEGSIWNMSVLV